MHAAVELPVKETSTRSVRAGNCATWPGLSVKAIGKYFPDGAEETLKGHLRDKRRGFRSTEEIIEKKPHEDKIPKRK